jgi:hypothetical protein
LKTFSAFFSNLKTFSPISPFSLKYNNGISTENFVVFNKIISNYLSSENSLFKNPFANVWLDAK